MTGALAGKRALVTAASQGLGLAIATRLADAGGALALCARGAEALNAAAESIAARTGRRPLTLTADLSVPADVVGMAEAAISGLGGLDILIVNSGHVTYGSMEELPDSAWYGAFELLLMSAVRLTRAALPAMRASGGGNIVFIGSASVRDPPPHLLLSSVMRLGVAGLAKTLARTLAPENIQVNVVAPGYFATGRVRRRIAERMQDGMAADQAMREVAGDIPMQRVGEPAELAELVAFLVEGKAGFLTGGHVVLDGGASAYPL
jgi:3-oxoacyl-[acyl-carrier protein] reductase